MPKPPRIVHGDCLDIMKMLPDNSVDSVVTDPPYGLGFMGKAWDKLPPGKDWADECLRVLKPGGHLLAFGGTRTWHRLAVAVEDAGFEIRDSIAWMYGSGFPKSLDVSKALDKVNGDGERLHKFAAWMRTTGLTARQLNDATGTSMGSHYLTGGNQPKLPTAATWRIIRPLIHTPIPTWVDESILRETAERPTLGRSPNDRNSNSTIDFNGKGRGYLTAPKTQAAKEWDGWGTALKPAFEPVVVARKALIGSVAANVQAHGAGALNIGGTKHGGRWPANVILDESQANSLTESRYFYVAKASKAERPTVSGVSHPTVKPLALMRWLVRLVTPPGGTVLEPFAGSGATVEACILEGFHCIAIEREAEYLPLIQARIDRQDAA